MSAEIIIELHDGQFSGDLKKLPDGVVFGSFEDIASLPEGAELFAAHVELSNLIGRRELSNNGGFFVFVPSGVRVEEPLFVKDNYSGDAVSSKNGVPAASFSTTDIVLLGNGAALTVFYELHAEGKCLVDRKMRFHLASDARLEYGELIDNGAEVEVVSDMVTLHKGLSAIRHEQASATRQSTPADNSASDHVDGAHAHITGVKVGGGQARLYYTSDLEQRGAEAGYSLLYLCGGEERVDVDVAVKHNVAECRSNVLVKGIAGGGAQGRFNGLVYVAPGAQHTEAYQQSRNILLSDTARITATPQLEIYADDVKCSHGATVGRQDGDQIYYMRQRGIPVEQARRLMLEGFMLDVLARIPEGDFRNTILGRLL